MSNEFLTGLTLDNPSYRKQPAYMRRRLIHPHSVTVIGWSLPKITGHPHAALRHHQDPDPQCLGRTAVATCERGEFATVIEGMMPILLHPDQQNGPLPQFVREMVARVGVEAFVRRHRVIGMRQDSRELLRAAKISVRAICGRQDGMSTIAEHVEIAELAPHGRFSIIEQCGHMTILERPQATTALLRDWLLYDT
jgi:pimeloyl-ACP methyl ester carboxylesterase